MIDQFIPEEICLKCQGCCRFREAVSVWSPCLLDEEVLSLIDKPDIPSAAIDANRRLCLVPDKKGELFLCPFLSLEDNKCRIYSMRPFECRLYPFLLNLRSNKIFLTVDLNCPYIREKLKSPELKNYIDYLTALLNSRKFLRLLKDNSHILQTYEDVLKIVELEEG